MTVPATWRVRALRCHSEACDFTYIIVVSRLDDVSSLKLPFEKGPRTADYQPTKGMASVSFCLTLASRKVDVQETCQSEATRLLAPQHLCDL